MKIQTRLNQIYELLKKGNDKEKRKLIIRYINKRSRSLFLRVKVVKPPLVSKHINDYPSAKNYAVIRNSKVLKKFIPIKVNTCNATLVIEDICDDKAYVIEILHELIAWLLIPSEIRILYARNKIPEWRQYLPPSKTIRKYEVLIQNTLWKL